MEKLEEFEKRVSNLEYTLRLYRRLLGGICVCLGLAVLVGADFAKSSFEELRVKKLIFVGADGVTPYGSISGDTDPDVTAHIQFGNTPEGGSQGSFELHLGKEQAHLFVDGGNDAGMALLTEGHSGHSSFYIQGRKDGGETISLDLTADANTPTPIVYDAGTTEYMLDAAWQVKPATSNPSKGESKLPSQEK